VLRSSVTDDTTLGITSASRLGDTVRCTTHHCDHINVTVLRSHDVHRIFICPHPCTRILTPLALEFSHNTTSGTGGNSLFMFDGLRQPRSALSRLIDT
jgi:hypothetical protein